MEQAVPVPVPSTSHRILPAVVILGAWLAVGSAWAAKLPAHVTDQPVPADRYPLREIDNNVERSLDRVFTGLKKDGFEPFANYWGTWLANPVGGERRSHAWAQLLVFGGEIHFDRIGWQGGSIFVSATDFAGSNLSHAVGNTFTLSQAVVSDTFALYGLYVKQVFRDDRLEFRVGRIAAGQLFATLPMMGLPVGGATNGNPTSLFTNAPFHATGAASWAAFVKGRPTTTTYVQAGAFQASPQTGVPSNHGVNFTIARGDGVLVMMEAGWLPTFGATGPDSGLPGQYSLGGYYANYTFPTFAGGVEHNAGGLYAQGQQMLWRSAVDARHHVTLWGGITVSPQEEFALLPVMGYGGATWQGLVPGRDRDALVLNFALGGFSRDYSRPQAQAGLGEATMEADLEASYIIQLTSNLQLQPDVQWIIQPGGSTRIPSALVLGFQVSAQF